MPHSETAAADLHLSQLQVSLPAAIRHCTAVGLPQTALTDESAVIKTALAESLSGGAALRPWRIISSAGGVVTVLGYSAAPLQLATLAIPSAQAAVSGLQSVPVPVLEAGTVLTLAATIVPTVNRTSGGEVDAFLHAVKDEGEDRVKVYRKYVEDRLKGCEVMDFKLSGFSLKAFVRKAGKSKAGWRATSRFPVATIRLRIRVTDADAFRRQLAAGLGRQKAFGYGFLRVLT